MYVETAQNQPCVHENEQNLQPQCIAELSVFAVYVYKWRDGFEKNAVKISTQGRDKQQQPRLQRFCKNVGPPKLGCHFHW